MNIKINLSIIIYFFCLLANAQINRVKINTENLIESNYLKVDDFYLTHYLYIDLFLRENLLPDAKLEEVSTVLDAIKKYVSEENPLVIEIEKSEGFNYIITVLLVKKDGDELLILYTNWNPELKKFENGINGDSYTRWYFLNYNKMTYRKDLSSEKDYSKLISIDLANAYLFDELKENDFEIEDAINKAIKNDNLNLVDNLTAQLILLKYYIFKRDAIKINEKIEYIKIQFENNKGETKLKGLEAAFNTTLFQIELMK